MKRLRTAFKTNEAQSTAMAMMSALTVIALAQRADYVPWWAYLVGAGVWPVIVFVINFFSPIK